jgi:hypothetical protein
MASAFDVCRPGGRFIATIYCDEPRRLKSALQKLVRFAGFVDGELDHRFPNEENECIRVAARKPAIETTPQPISLRRSPILPATMAVEGNYGFLTF